MTTNNLIPTHDR